MAQGPLSIERTPSACYDYDCQLCWCEMSLDGVRGACKVMALLAVALTFACIMQGGAGEGRLQNLHI